MIPLPVDLFGPVGPEGSPEGESHQKIPQLSGIQNICVVEADGPTRHLLAHFGETSFDSQ